MFKHLLLPTDGSAFSEAAARRALQLAKEQEARVTVIHVVPEFHVLSYRTSLMVCLGLQAAAAVLVLWRPAAEVRDA